MKAALAAALVIATARAAVAEPLSHAHFVRHAEVIGAGTVVYIVSETVLKSRLAPGACRWCAAPDFDQDLRDTLRWSDPGLADTLSNLDGYVLAPLVPLALVAGTTWRDTGDAEALDDGLTIVESGLATLLLDQAVKLAIGRARPFVASDPTLPHGTDDDLSFYSGHTSTAFAFATAAGTVASRRHQPLAPVVWGVGLGLAATTGYLRIAADKHYASDVVVGAVMGSAAGLLIPRLFHAHEVAVVPAPGGLAITGTF